MLASLLTSTLKWLGSARFSCFTCMLLRRAVKSNSSSQSKHLPSSSFQRALSKGVLALFQAAWMSNCAIPAAMLATFLQLVYQ